MSETSLTPGEKNILVDGLSDDVAFGWVLIHLGIRANSPATPGWWPSEVDVATAFGILRKMVEADLVRVGRLEYVDDGPSGRVAPVRHVAEEPAASEQRVLDAVRAKDDPQVWEFACWVVNTEKGDTVARGVVDEGLGSK